jgi:hypothetical protein
MSTESDYICRLQGMISRLEIDNGSLYAQLTTKATELARCQQIAIEERAKILSDPAAWDDRYETIRHPKTNIHSKDYFRERAAKELNLQLTQEAGYVERLEKEFLKVFELLEMGGMHREKCSQTAQAALAKIREGKP